jgi:hypothetical protein
MNIGVNTIEWLYSDQLKIDEKWSVKTKNGFKWWADKNAQTIEVIDKETNEDGIECFIISVKTAFLKKVKKNDKTLAAINSLIMPFSAMSGPVYNEEKETLSLCSLVRIHSEIESWMNPLISIAATMQIGEARIMGPEIAKLINAEQNFSSHPKSGMRPDPDEMALIIHNVIAPQGEKPCHWTEEEFQDVVDQYMQQPPSLFGSSGGLGFTVEFPYGKDTSSLCQVSGKEKHPRYGHGLLLIQSFMLDINSEEEGIRLALLLNNIELTQKPLGYGFGSYTFKDNIFSFTSFYPNLAYRKNFLPNIYFSCAKRAEQISILLEDCKWTKDSFNQERLAMFRKMKKP